MTLKKESNKLGKLIRKATGMPFVKAMKIAKVVIREGEYDLPNKFPEEIEKRDGCKCCGNFIYILKGDRTIELDYISKSSLEKEISFQQRMRSL